jgi:uncharacterized surface anchored protein
MNYFKRLSTTSVLVGSVILSALAYNITGTVKDATDEALEGASIRLLTPRDSALVSGVVAHQNGRFTMTGISNGSYIL